MDGRRPYREDLKIFNFVDVLNDKGLYIGLLFAYNNDIKNGLLISHFMRKIAEDCSNIRQSINLIKILPICFAKIFFVSDYSGAIAVEHLSGNRFAVVHPEENILIKTNFFVSKLKRFDEARNYFGPQRRFKRIKDLLEQQRDALNLRKIKGILDDSEVKSDSLTEKTLFQLLFDYRSNEFIFVSGDKRKRLKF
jgi:predicted choloylglycine hydrolase